MIPDQNKQLIIPDYKFKSFKESLNAAIDKSDINQKPSFGIDIKGKTKYWGLNLKKRDVRSVQRLHRPKNKSAIWVSHKYMEWLPQFFSFIIKVKVENNVCKFIGPFVKTPLLELTLSSDRSSTDRQLFILLGVTSHQKIKEEDAWNLEKQLVVIIF